MPPRTERAQAESAFYNRYAEQLSVDRVDPHRVFAPTCLENIQIVERLGDLKGKRVLDIGCGQGDTTVWFALQGAEVWALDVSDGLVEFARKLAERHGVSGRVRARVCRVEDMDYADGFFDVVFADGVLHHLDIRLAAPNIVRVMKPGGQGIFIEPQKGSFFIQIYRLFAKDLRSEDERPLERSDFDYLTGQFGDLDHREYHLLSLFLFGARFAMLKLTGKTFPYWMDEVRAGGFCPGLLRRLQAVDDWLLRRVKWLRWYTWMTVLMPRKTDRL